jgi:hypothetical protein
MDLKFTKRSGATTLIPIKESGAQTLRFTRRNGATHDIKLEDALNLGWNDGLRFTHRDGRFSSVAIPPRGLFYPDQVHTKLAAGATVNGGAQTSALAYFTRAIVSASVVKVKGGGWHDFGFPDFAMWIDPTVSTWPILLGTPLYLRLLAYSRTASVYGFPWWALPMPDEVEQTNYEFDDSWPRPPAGHMLVTLRAVAEDGLFCDVPLRMSMTDKDKPEW